MINYKGLFYKEDSKKPFYEGGAHFKYKDLVRALEALKAKKDEEENEKKHHSRNKSINYIQDKDIFIPKNPISNLITIDNNYNNYNNYESPQKKRNNNNYIEQLLSLDKLKLSKKRKLKLKDIKYDNKQNEAFLYTENNRYNNNNNESKIRSNSLDINLLNAKNDNINKILLSEKKYNNKNNNNNIIHNLKLLPNSNTKSFKNLSTITSLPKIESLYFNNISKKILVENNSNSNLATDATNKRNDYIDPKTKMENEINKNLKLPDFNYFSIKKKLPHLNFQSMSTLDNNKSNRIYDKNRQIFTINKNNKEDFSVNQKKDNKYDIETDDALKSINLKKDNYKILKLANYDKDKKNDLKSKLFSIKNKKSGRKSEKKSLDD
jgi:hypothetical protein